MREIKWAIKPSHSENSSFVSYKQKTNDWFSIRHSYTWNVAWDLWHLFHILDMFRESWDDNVACASLSDDVTQKVYCKRHTWRMSPFLKSPPAILQWKKMLHCKFFTFKNLLNGCGVEFSLKLYRSIKLQGKNNLKKKKTGKIL